jgi:hypothetical protein
VGAGWVAVEEMEWMSRKVHLEVGQSWETTYSFSFAPEEQV